MNKVGLIKSKLDKQMLPTDCKVNMFPKVPVFQTFDEQMDKRLKVRSILRQWNELDQ